MRKLLLSAMALTTASMFAINEPQSGFYLSGINSETEATANNTLTYVPGDEDDIEEGIYRYINEAVEITEESGMFTIVGAEGMMLGYDDNNIMGAFNVINNIQNMLYLKEDGDAVNYKLDAGTYKVILASMMMEEDEPLTWMIQFSQNSSDETYTYYIYGLNGMDEPSQANMLVEQVFEEEDAEILVYTYPKFYIEDCENGFYIGTADKTIIYGSDSSEVTEDVPLAILHENEGPVKTTLTPGYYKINFSLTGNMAMISFLKAEDQTPVDEATYYLLGFDGVTTAQESVKFDRQVITYEDEETGDIEETVMCVIEKIHLSSCPDGFTVATENGDFTFGINTELGAVFGTTITDEIPFGFLGINGKPHNWDMTEEDYTVNFVVSDSFASISFLLYGESAVEKIAQDSEDIAPVYYNLQGQRVNNPDKGLFIKVQGDKVTKILK